MSDHEDAQDYTANGPSNFGFRTGGANIQVGVDAAGIDIGVRGVSAGQPDTTRPSDAGVVGESSGGGFGVRGSGTNVAGVFGESKDGPGVRGSSKSGTGVEGNGDKVGVFGETSSNDFGVGVLGESTAGIGVSGHSRKGRGGSFESEHGDAQLRLVPQEGKSKPPKTGNAGDFLVVLLPLPRAADEPERKAAQLWFCTQSSVENVQDASWAKVDLSQI